MKFFFSLLFLPFIGFTQVTYEEIMSINSADAFEEVVVKNGYTKEDAVGKENHMVYSLNSYENSNQEVLAEAYCLYDLKSDLFVFIFERTEEEIYDTYLNILSDITEKCNYYKIINHLTGEYVAYDCPDSKYKGKIGVARIKSEGYIIHLTEY